MDKIKICSFTQCIRCNYFWHFCDEFIGDCEIFAEVREYCLYCGHCQICGCCGNCGKLECENEHI